MPIISTMNGTTQVLLPVTYREVPFYLSIWFYLGMMLALVSITFFIYQFIKYRQKNRLVVRIHNPDKSINTYVYRKFSSQTFHIKSDEKSADGNDLFYDYKLIPECIETGLWGKYIEYHYGNPEPINFKDKTDDDNIPAILRFFNSFIDTRLLADLVLGSKWKDLVTMLLVIILIEGIIGIALNIIMPLAVSSHPTCSLAADNRTISTIVQSVKIGLSQR